MNTSPNVMWLRLGLKLYDKGIFMNCGFFGGSRLVEFTELSVPRLSGRILRGGERKDSSDYASRVALGAGDPQDFLLNRSSVKRVAGW